MRLPQFWGFSQAPDTAKSLTAERPELHALSELHGAVVEASQHLLDVLDTAVLDHVFFSHEYG